MPTKFRKNVWVKRGDYIIVEPIEEGDKVKAEICKILTPEHIKEYTKAGVWPQNFSKKSNDYNGADNKAVTSGLDEDDESEDNDDDLEPNMNRPVAQVIEETDDDSTEEEDDSSTEEN